jgi:chemotaxis response regulator CheB
MEYCWPRLERAVEKIRVLVANQPRLMRELVLETITDQPDIEVIGEVSDDAEIQVAVAEAHPDVVIVALTKTNKRPMLCADLMETFPQLKIVAVSPERNSSMLIWSVVDIHSTDIECSEDGILAAVRGKVLAVNK